MIKIPSVKKMWENYLVIKKRLIRNNKSMNIIKTWFVFVLFLLSIWIYGYFINISSTKWYFIRVEKDKLSEVKFQNEIIKIDVKKLEWDIFSNILPINIQNAQIVSWKIMYLSDILKVVVK